MTIGIGERPYAVIGEFDSVDAVVHAAEAARATGFTRVEGYSPFPIPALSHALLRRPSRIPAVVLAGGLLGGSAAYTFQWWVHTVHNAINVGGRPLHSWPNFIPVTFEMTILGASTAAVIGMLAANGLPRLHHPIFNHERFSQASIDRYFLAIETSDPLASERDVAGFLRDCGAVEVADVPR